MVKLSSSSVSLGNRQIFMIFIENKAGNWKLKSANFLGNINGYQAKVLKYWFLLGHQPYRKIASLYDLYNLYESVPL